MISLFLIYSKDINYCVVNEDCKDLNYCVLNKCIHKRYLPPTIKEIFGSVLIVLGSALSNIGGIGGGGIMSPIMKFYMNFNKGDGVTIAKLMIFCGSLTGLLLKRNQNIPNTDKSPIDFNLVILLIPSVLYGTSIGVILNQIIPQIISYFLVILIIGVNFYKTYNLFTTLKTQQLKKENKKEQEYTNINTSDTEAGSRVNDKSDMNKSLRLLFELEKDKLKFPMFKMVYAFISILVLVMISMIKGSKTINSIVFIDNCSTLFWFIEFLYFPVSLGLVYLVSKNIKKEFNYRKDIGYKFLPSDIIWNNRNIFKFSLIGLVTGILSGTLGLGGGLILVPLLLSFDVQPLIATSTSLMVVLFESLSVCFQSILLGVLNIDYLIICPILSSIGGLIGTVISRAYIAKTNKSYILVGVVALCLAITLIIFGYNFLVLSRRVLNEEYNLFEFNTPCSD